MNKICTTIGQSKKLIELGIDVNTADMCWCGRKLQWGEIKETMIAYPILPIQEKSEVFKYTPAWSLTALMELMNRNCYNVSLNCHGVEWNVKFDDSEKYKEFTKDYAVDAAFEMVVWLKQNGKL